MCNMPLWTLALTTDESVMMTQQHRLLLAIAS